MNNNSRTATVIDAHNMTPGMARYWVAKAASLAGKVDFVDPWRLSVASLRKRGISGVIYRASTGGRWGKSSAIVTL